MYISGTVANASRTTRGLTAWFLTTDTDQCSRLSALYRVVVCCCHWQWTSVYTYRTNSNYDYDASESEKDAMNFTHGVTGDDTHRHMDRHRQTDRHVCRHCWTWARPVSSRRTGVYADPASISRASSSSAAAVAVVNCTWTEPYVTSQPHTYLH